MIGLNSLHRILPALLCLPIVQSILDEVCQDLYGRYCEALTPEKCYQAYNRKLCCSTCEVFRMKLEVQTPDADECFYGDRMPECSTMDGHLCYDSAHRFSCCRTCQHRRTNIEDCEYGDLNSPVCAATKSHHCYKGAVAEECCGTCSKHYTGRKGCEYGDRVKFFRKHRRMYNCQAYVAHFGYGRCGLPWEEDFSFYCCGSCHDAVGTRKSNRVYAYGK